MKEKLSDFFYYLVVFFGVVVIIGNVIFLIFGNITDSQNGKVEYEISAPPVLDSFGNLYYFKKTYNHIPTKKDSLEFEKEKKNLFK